MSVTKTTLAAFMLASFLTVMVPAHVCADNSISPKLFTQYVNRIIWVDWHSGGKSYVTEGTLKMVHPAENCISLVIRQKFPEEVLKFDGSRVLYINLSSIDAFEIRLPE